jgi:hypothetical protein
MASPTGVNVADGAHVTRSLDHPALVQFTDSCYVGADVAISPARNVNVAATVRAKDGRTVAMLIWMDLGVTATMTVSQNGRVIDIEHLRGG